MAILFSVKPTFFISGWIRLKTSYANPNLSESISAKVLFLAAARIASSARFSRASLISYGEIIPCFDNLEAAVFTSCSSAFIQT